MSQSLTLKLNDRVFTAIQQQAKKIGIPPELLAASLLEKQFAQMSKFMLSDREKEVARAKFERHFGSLALDVAINVDNESIDTELAEEYASTHEKE